MRYSKLSADCEKNLFEKIRRACEAERRTLSNFVRLACEKYANEVLQKDGENGN